MNATQKIVRISFRYDGSYTQFEPFLDGFVAQLREVPGLLWKIWTYDESRSCGAGIYLFGSEADARAYLSYMVPQMRQMCRDVEAEVLDFHVRATEGTRGPVGQRWASLGRTSMSDEREEGIKATLLGYMNGWLERDIDALMRLWDQHEADVTYVPAELVAPVFGHAALRAYSEQVSKNFPIISGAFGDFAVRSVGDMAYSVSHFNWKFKAGDVELTTRIRNTALLRQRGGAWYFVHMHESITWQPA